MRFSSAESLVTLSALRPSRGASMLQRYMRPLKDRWPELMATDLLFKVLGFVIFYPTLGLLFRVFLWFSGQTVLADVDIAKFALHPLGWLTGIVIVGGSIGILALEQATLLLLVWGTTHDRHPTMSSCLVIVYGKVREIFRLTIRIVAWLLLVSGPFVVLGGILYLALLTKHDINFYLAERPPIFWVATILIGLTLAAMAVVIARYLIRWVIALPLCVLEGVPAGRCLGVSREVTAGKKWLITKSLGLWFTLNILLSSLLTGLAALIGQWIIPDEVRSLWYLVISFGFVLVLLFALQLLLNMIAAVSFSILQAYLYDQIDRAQHVAIPQNEASISNWPQLTQGRVISAIVLIVLGAAVLGASAIHSVRFEDDVDITAHRGASAMAPENTLASVRQAIEGGADWVEIDVQESLDGVVIVAHDSDFKKVSGDDRKVWEMTLEDMKQLDIGSYFAPEFRTERVPTLKEVLQMCRGKVGVNIELKYYGHDQQLEQKVIDLVEQYKMDNDVLIMSLKLTGISKVRQLRPTWKIGLLTAVTVSDLTRVDADFLAVNQDLAQPAFIQRAHQRGKEVFAWTINDAATMSSMMSRGVDNIITDDPELAKQVLQERAAMSPAERLLVELSYVVGL